MTAGALAPARRRRAVGIIQWGVTAASLAFLGHRLVRNVGELPAVAPRWQAVLAIAAAGVLVVVIEALHSLGFLGLLRASDPSASWRASFEICGRSQLFKYLPGNVFHWVERTRLVNGRGISTATAAAISIADLLLIGGAGALVALPAARRAVGLVAAQLPRGGLSPWVAVGVAGCAAAVAVAVRLRAISAPAEIVRLLSPARLVPALVAQLLGHAVAGVLVLLVLRGVWPAATAPGLGELISGFALAFVVGFITPGAPGGIGVREAALYAQFAPVLGSGLAAALFLLVRFVFSAGDVLTFLAARALAPRPQGVA